MNTLTLDGRGRDLEAATRGLYEELLQAVADGVEQVVLLSTLSVFSRIPRNWHLDTRWMPRPSPEPEQLFPYLSERCAQEVARATGLRIEIQRLGDGAAPVAPEPAVPWRVRHIGECAARPESDGGRAWEEVLGPVAPVASQPVKKVVLLGAGGPIGRVVADELKERYTLRLADIKPLAASELQSEGAPVAQGLPAPHEEAYVDIRDYDSVLAACTGCDAIINLTVNRPHPVLAFQVNTIGAYQIGRVAAALGIRRVVHTGPQLLTLHGENDFLNDFQIAGDSPTRPGRHLYGHSKFLGNEALRVFAHWYDLEVPNLMFNGFAQPDAVSEHGTSAMMLTWQDAARAIRCALDVPSLPSPYEEFHCVADFPHGQCRTDKAKQLLGWQPQDRLTRLWRTG